MKWGVSVAALAFAAGIGVAALPAQTALVTEGFTGIITFGAAGNPFGSAGDPVSGSTTYDDDLLTGVGAESIATDSNKDFDLTMFIGTQIFEEFQDVDFGGGFPLIQFTDGVLNGFDSVVDFDFIPPVNGTELALQQVGELLGLTFSVEGRLFEIIDSQEDTLLAGEFFDGAVPETGALALLAAGLIGLGLAGRRRRAA